MRLDLCCGPRKPEGYLGIDILQFKGVDRVHDLNYGIPFPDEHFDEVRAHDAIEHIESGKMLFNEIWRVLKDGGLVDILVPSTDGRGAFQDLTHVSYWNENSFRYWTNPAPFLDYYRGKCLFEMVELYTTPLSQDMVRHVVFKARAVKNVNWVHLVKERLGNILGEQS